MSTSISDLNAQHDCERELINRVYNTYIVVLCVCLYYYFISIENRYNFKWERTQKDRRQKKLHDNVIL